VGEMFCSSTVCWFEITKRVREELQFANECTTEQNLLLLKDPNAAYATTLGVITNLNVVNGHADI